MHAIWDVVQNIQKFRGHYPIFTEVIAKKSIKLTDRQIYLVRIKKIFRTGPSWSWDVFNINNNNKIKIGTFFEKISVNKHSKIYIQTNCINSFLGKSIKMKFKVSQLRIFTLEFKVSCLIYFKINYIIHHKANLKRYNRLRNL